MRNHHYRALRTRCSKHSHDEQISDSAISRKDSPSTYITIPAGHATLAMAIVALDDAVGEGTEVVTVSITASDAYRTGSPATAAVSIVDND